MLENFVKSAIICGNLRVIYLVGLIINVHMFNLFNYFFNHNRLEGVLGCLARCITQIGLHFLSKQRHRLSLLIFRHFRISYELLCSFELPTSLDGIY